MRFIKVYIKLTTSISVFFYHIDFKVYIKLTTSISVFFYHMTL